MLHRPEAGKLTLVCRRFQHRRFTKDDLLGRRRYLLKHSTLGWTEDLHIFLPGVPQQDAVFHG
jgi:hypothetical protein